MKLRMIWIGISLFLSSFLIATIAAWILGGSDATGITVFGVVMGLNVLENLICFLAGGIVVTGMKARRKV